MTLFNIYWVHAPVPYLVKQCHTVLISWDTPDTKYINGVVICDIDMKVYMTIIYHLELQLKLFSIAQCSTTLYSQNVAGM